MLPFPNSQFRDAHRAMDRGELACVMSRRILRCLGRREKQHLRVPGVGGTRRALV